MKFNTTLLTSALLPLGLPTAFAAQELTPEKAAALQPFKRISFTGRFNSLQDVSRAVSIRADSLGAGAF